MTWWQAYGRDKAIDQMINKMADGDAGNPANEEITVFTPTYTMPKRAFTRV